MDEMIPSLRTEMARKPRAVVVNLGTNDALQARTHSGWLMASTPYGRSTRSRPCVVFVTVSTYADNLGKGTVADDINHAIRKLAAEHHNVHIVDWNAAVHTEPEPPCEPQPAGRQHSPLLVARAGDGWAVTTATRCSPAGSTPPDRAAEDFFAANLEPGVEFLVFRSSSRWNEPLTTGRRSWEIQLSTSRSVRKILTPRAPSTASSSDGRTRRAASTATRTSTAACPRARSRVASARPKAARRW